MWTIFKVFIELVTVLLLFYVLVLWTKICGNISTSTRDWIFTPYLGRQSLNHWTARKVHFNVAPKWCFFFKKNLLERSLFMSFLLLSRYTAEWISYTYTYIHSVLDYFSHIGHYRVLNRVFAVLYSRSLLVVYFIYNRCSYYSFEIPFSFNELSYFIICTTLIILNSYTVLPQLFLFTSFSCTWEQGPNFYSF